MSSHAVSLSTFEGGSALSAFRAAALLARVQAVAPRVAAVHARHVHVVATDETPTPELAATLGRLLTYGPAYAGPPASVGTLVVVTPRLGTISPWASKATDIARSCGVDVRRIERVTEFILTGDELTPEQWAACADILHDRMTETALPSLDDAQALFATREAAPMEHVDVLGEGRAGGGECGIRTRVVGGRGRLSRRCLHRARA